LKACAGLAWKSRKVFGARVSRIFYRQPAKKSVEKVNFLLDKCENAGL